MWYGYVKFSISSHSKFVNYRRWKFVFLQYHSIQLRIFCDIYKTAYPSSSWRIVSFFCHGEDPCFAVDFSPWKTPRFSSCSTVKRRACLFRWNYILGHRALPNKTSICSLKMFVKPFTRKPVRTPNSLYSTDNNVVQSLRIVHRHQ